MKTPLEMKKARHQIALYERHRSGSENQRAFLFGARSCLGLLRFKLPIGREAWIKMLLEMCQAFDARRQAPHYPDLERDVTPKLAMELSILRIMASKVLDDFQIPPLHKAVLVGVRSVLAWAMDLPYGAKNFELVLADQPLESAVPLAMSGVLAINPGDM